MKLIIPADLERRLHAYTLSVDAEIAGMGSVEMREDGNLWVTDIAIYDQEVSGGTADLSPQALAFFQTDLVKRGISPKTWYLWWHSHNTFSAFFSPTDTGTIASSTEFDHIVSLVVNKKRERKCRVDTHRPFRMFSDNVVIEIAPEVNQRTLEIDERIHGLAVQIQELQAERNAFQFELPDVSEEVAEKVRIKKPAYKPAGFHNNAQQKGDKSFLQLPFNDEWSKKRKKDGTVSTPADVIGRNLEDVEVLLLIEQTQTMIKAHEANGNGDTVECIELRADLATYNQYLDQLEDAAYRGFPDEDMYWDGKRGGWAPLADAEDDDEMGLPPLPKGYRYTLSSSKEEQA